ncbi:unnamed protein product, partial [Nesidiocoris tenuis]
MSTIRRFPAQEKIPLESKYEFVRRKFYYECVERDGVRSRRCSSPAQHSQHPPQKPTQHPPQPPGRLAHSGCSGGPPGAIDPPMWPGRRAAYVPPSGVREN